MKYTPNTTSAATVQTSSVHASVNTPFSAFNIKAYDASYGTATTNNSAGSESDDRQRAGPGTSGGSPAVLVLLVCIVLFMTQLTFVVLRLGDNITWLWSIVLIPTWVLLALMLVLWARHLSLAFSIGAYQSISTAAIPAAGAHGNLIHVALAVRQSGAHLSLVTTQVLGATAFAILLALRLDVDALSTMAWSIVAIPLWCILVMWFIVSVWPLCKPTHATTTAAVAAAAHTHNPVARTAEWLYGLAVSLSFASIAVLLALVLVRLDAPGAATWSWTAVLVPAATVWLVVQACWLIGHIVVKINTSQHSLLTYGKNWFVIVIEIITLLTAIAALVTLTLYLEEDDPTRRSATQLFWPLFLYGFVVAVLCWFQGFLDKN
jgi:hypothetical protein